MKYILSTLLIGALSITLHAKEVVVEMLNKRPDGAKMVYSEDVTKIEAGDTIKWVPTSKGHNVEFLGGPDGATLPGKSGLNKEVSIKFDKPGVYLYVCTPHKVMGMIALVVVGGDTSNKTDIAKIKMMGRSKKKLASLIEGI